MYAFRSEYQIVLRSKSDEIAVWRIRAEAVTPVISSTPPPPAISR
jgi:hypothetical protein